MKRSLTINLFAIALIVAACGNNKADQQKQMDDVMALHDKVMGYDEAAIKNKARLDSLAKMPTLAIKKDTMLVLSRELAAADSAMSEWMTKFNPDFKDKSENDVKAYLADQKKQIMQIDTQFSTALAHSNTFLKQLNTAK